MDHLRYVKNRLPRKSKKIIRPTAILLILITFICLSAIILHILSIRQLPPDIIEPIGILVSGLLSLALAFVYWDISTTQDRILEAQLSRSDLISKQKTAMVEQKEAMEEQKKTMKQQEEIMRDELGLIENQAEPKIVLEEFRYHEDNTFYLQLSNLGNGPADDLRVRIEPTLYHWSKKDEELIETPSGLMNHNEQVSPVQRSQGEGTILYDKRYLEAGEKNTAFKTDIKFEFNEDTDGFFSSFKGHQGHTTPNRLLRDAVGRTKFSNFDSYLSSRKLDEGFSSDEIRKSFEKIPFNRLRLQVTLSYFSINREHNELNDIIDIIIPIDPETQDELKENKIWELAMEFDEYEKETKKHAHHLNGMDQIGVKYDIERHTNNQISDLN